MSLQVQLELQRGAFALSLSEEFAGGGITGITGPSGCGKTSLLRAIAGLDRHPRARIRLNGHCWQDAAHWLPVHERPLGYVFQEPGLFAHLSVLDNLRYGWRRRAGDPAALEAATDGLGIRHLLARSPATLSGGERQRVAMARALASRPGLLLMDEPLVALDAEARAGLLPWLDALHGSLEIPLLYVSHALDEIARLADRLLLLGEGRVLAHGPTATILTRLDLPLAQRPEAESIISAKVTGHDAEYQLSCLQFAAERAWVRAQAAPIGTELRLRIAARDVSLALERPRHSSILNIFAATVVEIRAQGDAQALVALDTGGQALLARVTRKSVAELALRPGLQLYAQAKSVALLN